MMKKLLILLAVSLSTIANSQTPAKLVPTSIEKVTVFLSGAQVTRTAKMDLKTGEQTIRLSQLSPYIDPNSIQIKGNDQYTIISVKHQVNFQTGTALPANAQAKVDSLEEMRFTLKMRQSLKGVYQSEKNLLLANHNIKGNNTLLVEDLEEMIDFQRKRMKEVEYKLLEISEEEKELTEDIRRLQNQVSQFVQQQQFNSGEILVTLKCNTKASANLELSYLVGQAGWFPVYDVRAKDINEPLELVYRGQVFQSTGNDWERVDITLSTGNPTAGGQAPELQTWQLYLSDPYRAKSYGNKNAYSQKQAPKQEQNYDLVTIDSNDKSSIQKFKNTDLVRMNNSGINTEFNIEIPYDIPSDGQAYNVEMQRSSMEANFKYLAIPKLDKDAFLLADITDWQKYNLLAGESNIYFQGTFVGKAFIDPANTEDTLSLSLGRDPGIVVSRDRIASYCNSSTLLGKRKISKGYEIVVKNNKTKAVSITIQDQLPLSSSDEIEVTHEDLSNGKVDSENGKVSWELELAPGESKTIVLKYSVKFPKKKIIPNL